MFWIRLWARLFSEAMIDLYFLRTAVVVLFLQKSVLLYNSRNNYARVILVANLCVDAKQLVER